MIFIKTICEEHWRVYFHGRKYFVLKLGASSNSAAVQINIDLLFQDTKQGPNTSSMMLWKSSKHSGRRYNQILHNMTEFK